jgi:hypothetical protein
MHDNEPVSMVERIITAFMTAFLLYAVMYAAEIFYLGYRIGLL